MIRFQKGTATFQLDHQGLDNSDPSRSEGPFVLSKQDRRRRWHRAPPSGSDIEAQYLYFNVPVWYALASTFVAVRFSRLGCITTVALLL
jgi:hypothetical protein